MTDQECSPADGPGSLGTSPLLSPGTGGADAVFGQAQQRGQQGQGEQDGDRDRAGRDDGHGAEQRDADDQEPGQGDDDGAAGEEDRAPGGAERTAGRFLRVHALVEDQPAFPVDDEQRVVDADGQPQHQRQHRREGVDLEHAGEGEGAADTHRDTGQGDDQRQPRRDDRSQGDQQDKGRHDDTDDLPDADDVGDLHHRRRRQDFQVGGRGLPLGGPDGAVDRPGRKFEGLLVELELHQRGCAVGGDDDARHRPATLLQGDGCLAGGRRSSGSGPRRLRPQQGAVLALGGFPGQGFPDVDDVVVAVDGVDGCQQGGPDLLVVDPGALRSGEEQHALAAGCLREGGGQAVDDLLGRGAVDTDLVAELDRMGHEQKDDRRQYGQPAPDDVPGLAVGELPQPVQQNGHRVLPRLQAA